MEFKPRARPVAELVLDGLLERDRELARQWAVALILARPIEQLGDLPLGELAGEAPALCAQALRALGSDAELERLAAGEGVAGSGRESPSPQRVVGGLLGATSPPAAVAAVEALRGVLWEALLDEILRPGPRLLGDVADRLACVCATILAVALAGARLPVPERAAEQLGGTADWERQAVPDAGNRRRATLVDELQGIVSPAPPVAGWDPFGRRGAAAKAGSAGSPNPPWIASEPRPIARPLPWDTPSAEGLTARRTGLGATRLADEPA